MVMTLTPFRDGVTYRLFCINNGDTPLFHTLKNIDVLDQGMSCTMI